MYSNSFRLSVCLSVRLSVRYNLAIPVKIAIIRRVKYRRAVNLSQLCSDISQNIQNRDVVSMER